MNVWMNEWMNEWNLCQAEQLTTTQGYEQMTILKTLASKSQPRYTDPFSNSESLNSSKATVPTVKVVNRWLIESFQ
jgi:hypothetical protein